MSDVAVDKRILSFLEKQTNLILATARRDGSPQLSPVWYLWKDGAFVISTNTRTAKWWNLKKDPRCSVCVDEPATGQMVVAYGEADLDDGDVWDTTWKLVAKYRQLEEVQGHMDEIFTGQQRVLITVRPRKLIPRNL